MTIVSCPRCHEQVTVPAGVGGQAHVRCPLCQEEYRLDLALDQLPPQLIVLNPAGVVEEADGFEVPDEERFAMFPTPLGRPTRIAAMAESSSDVTTESATESGDEWLSEAPSLAPAPPAFRYETGSARPTQVSTHPRTNRKPASPFKAIVQVVGGGVLGLVIAQFILWWMPGSWPRENRDPLGLADSVARHAPYLLPAQLRSAELMAGLSGEGDRRDGDFTFSEPDGTAGRTNDVPDAHAAPHSMAPDSRAPVTAATEAAATEAAATDAAATQSSATDAAAGSSSVDRSPRAGSANAGDVTAAKVGAPLRSVEPSDIPPLDKVPLPAPASVGIPEIALDLPSPTAASLSQRDRDVHQLKLRNVPRVDPAAITRSLATLAEAERAWNAGVDAPRAEKQRLFSELYAAIAGLGESLAYAEATESSATESLSEVRSRLRALATEEAKLSLIGRFWEYWLQQERSNQGAVLYGTVVGYQPAGRVAEMRLKLASRREPEVRVVTSADVSQQLPAGARALVVGVIMADPSQHVEGYQGDAQEVIVAGMQLLVPHAADGGNSP